MAFMVIAIVVIEVVKRNTRNIQNFVFGTDIDTPIVNLVQTFFGIGEITLPTTLSIKI